jgi:hypothetical protein
MGQLMATAKKISEVATLRAMSAYMDLRANNNRIAVIVEGVRTKDLTEKYGVGDVRVRQLASKGERLCNPVHHWTYGLLTKKELRDLNHIGDWLEFLASTDNIDAPKLK